MMLVEETTVDDAALPVAALGAFLRLGSGFGTDGLQDDLLRAFLRAALAAIEGRINKILIARSFAQQMTSGQALAVGPLRAVLSVTVDGTAQPYALAGTTITAPTTAKLTVRYDAGLADDFAALPADLQQAVLMLAAHYYEYRQDPALDGACMPFGVSALTERYRTLRLSMGART
ncbi:head-tail connector protein [Ketogulonicigenium vulgare]|uniref:head-tail connector protein n=1 Tax=Ketogulonicigenium vulgare TaxID=92945 RepID=UPI0023592C2F|nr:head-tail connector protein [Ketogulonicigenium vulgare]